MKRAVSPICHPLRRIHDDIGCTTSARPEHSCGALRVRRHKPVGEEMHPAVYKKMRLMWVLYLRSDPRSVC